MVDKTSAEGVGVATDLELVLARLSGRRGVEQILSENLWKKNIR